MIAWVLLEREAMYTSEKFNVNRREALRRSTEPADQLKLADPQIWPHFKDNWYRFLIHKLVVGCPKSSDLFEKNDVTFVTFNYDVSLEYHLFRGLSAISLFKEGDIITKFFAGERILHMYGTIRDMPFGDPPPFDLKLSSGALNPLERSDPTRYWTANKNLFDTIYDASIGIRTIAPSEKGILNEDVKAASTAIHDACCVYILGYGFDPANNELLDLRAAAADNQFTKRNILFTNFEDSGVVNTRASRTFGPRREFLVPGPQAFEVGNVYIEKSIRDVYKALSLDFEAPEESPIPSR
jgi:hypothetical protein